MTLAAALLALAVAVTYLVFAPMDANGWIILGAFVASVVALGFALSEYDRRRPGGL